MNTIDKTDQIFQILESDCPIDRWKLGTDGHVILTNARNDRILNIMMEHNGIKEILLEHFAKSSSPLFITNFLRMTWLILADHADDGCYFYMIGPSFTTETARNAACRYPDLIVDIVSSWKIHFREIIAQLHIIPYHTLLSYGKMLYYFLSGKTIDTASFAYIYVDEASIPHSCDEEPADMEEEKFPLLSWTAETSLLEQIRNKNPYYGTEVNSILSAAQQFTTDKSTAALRAIIFTSLACRTAAHSGLSMSTAMALEHLYLSEFNRKCPISEINRLLRQLYHTLIEMLLKTDMYSGYSEQVRNCMEYISLHVEDDIRLFDLASQNGYTTYYISRKFKHETGISINEYILQARLARAKELLLSTDCSIQVISDRLMFCSRSYFTKLFREHQGMTPTEYRRIMNTSEAKRT